jgi:hypothetical protein
MASGTCWRVPGTYWRVPASCWRVPVYRCWVWVRVPGFWEKTGGYPPNTLQHTYVHNLNANMHVNMHIHTFVYVYLHIYIYIYVCIFICIHICRPSDRASVEMCIHLTQWDTCVTQILWLQANDKSGFIIGLDPIPAQG